MESETDSHCAQNLEQGFPAPWKLLYGRCCPTCLAVRGHCTPSPLLPLYLPSVSYCPRPSSWTDLAKGISSFCRPPGAINAAGSRERQIGSRHGFPAIVMVSSSLSLDFNVPLPSSPLSSSCLPHHHSYTELCDSMSTARSHSFVRSSPHNNFLTLYHSMGFCFLSETLHLTVAEAFFLLFGISGSEKKNRRSWRADVASLFT